MTAPEAGPISREAALRRSRDMLATAGCPSAAEDARALLLAAGGIDALALLTDPRAPLTADANARLGAWLVRRAAGEPVTRILGRRHFWTLDLAVRPNVLDPRPDSEAVVRLALRRNVAAARRILDLGSGSGALLCALLAEAPAAFGVAVDLSADACAATAANLAATGFAERAAVLRGAWGAALAAPFDLVVSNPPYIPRAELAGLEPAVRAHDPALALDGGPDGLDAYRALLPHAARLAGRAGEIVVEIGAGAEAALTALARASGLACVDRERDLGGHVRALCLAPAAGSGGTPGRGDVSDDVADHVALGATGKTG